MSKLLIIIPAYNEEANIVKVVNGIVKNYPQYDYVVVNDGSRDKTAAICREHGFRLIDLPVNLGLAGAFQTGLRYTIISYFYISYNSCVICEKTVFSDFGGESAY